MQKNKFKIPLAISASLILFGMNFKIMHWPGSMAIIAAGYILLAIFYALRFSFKLEKKVLDVTKLVLVMLYCYQSILTVMHYPRYEEVQYLIWILILTLIVQEVIHYYREGKFSFSIDFIKAPLFYLGLGGVVFGSMFKIQHWPYASMFLILGTTITCSTIIWYSFKKKDSL
jgi:hypothetical protein